MSETTFTLPAELEFDPDNYGSCRLAFGLLDDHGHSSDISIEGSGDRAIALANEVVRRWNAHDALVELAKQNVGLCDQILDKFDWRDFPHLRKGVEVHRSNLVAALAKARGEA